MKYLVRISAICMSMALLILNLLVLNLPVCALVKKFSGVYRVAIVDIVALVEHASKVCGDCNEGSAIQIKCTSARNEITFCICT